MSTSHYFHFTNTLRLQKRIRNAIDQLGKLLQRIRCAINYKTSPLATRYLKTAISNSNHNKAELALNNKSYQEFEVKSGLKKGEI